MAGGSPWTGWSRSKKECAGPCPGWCTGSMQTADWQVRSCWAAAGTEGTSNPEELSTHRWSSSPNTQGASETTSRPAAAAEGRISSLRVVEKIAVARIPNITGCSGEYLQCSLEVVWKAGIHHSDGQQEGVCQPQIHRVCISLLHLQQAE